VTLFLSVIAVAIVAGYAFGGRLRRFEEYRPRWWALAPIGLALQFVPVHTTAEGGSPLGDALLIGSYVLLLAFAVRNLRTMGFPLILAGLALNLAVIAPNGGMPVTREAVIGSGQANLMRDLREGHLAKHHLESSQDVLRPLDDRFVLGPPIRQVASVGDALIYAGLVLLVVAVMRGRTPEARPSPSDPRRSPATEPPPGSPPDQTGSSA